MTTANLTDVKNGFSAYVAKVRRGERIRILSHGVPVAELVPISPTRASASDEEARLADLERRGIIRRGVGGIPPEIMRPGPRIKGRPASEILIEERHAGR